MIDADDQMCTVKADTIGVFFMTADSPFFDAITRKFPNAIGGGGGRGGGGGEGGISSIATRKGTLDLDLDLASL